MNSQIEKLTQVFDRQKAAFALNRYPSLKEREERLDALIGMMVTNRQRLHEALQEDFGCHPQEQSDLLDILAVVARLMAAKSSLAEWMAVSRRATSPDLHGSSQAYMRLEPKGVIGNMSPWNFPIDIGIGPLAEIIGAGNRAIIKPSDMTPAYAELLEEILPKAIDPDIVGVAVGDIELAKAFPKLTWDHLMYTGNPTVAKSIAAESARNLTPLTLELGGKCPVILTDEAVNERSIAHILRVKMVKSGQMCVAPDYILAPRAKLAEVVELCRNWIQKNAPDYVSGDDITGIINSRHYERLEGMLDDLDGTDAEIVQLSANSHPETRRMALYLVVNPPADSRLMQDEIFGPILPVVAHDGLDDAIAQINSGDHPLGLYAFTDDADEQQKILDKTQSGGVTINSVAFHSALANMGFGGTGMSGYGLHHGIEGFREFSNHRGIMIADKHAGMITVSPPYGPEATAIINAALGI